MKRREVETPAGRIDSLTLTESSMEIIRNIRNKGRSGEDLVGEAGSSVVGQFGGIDPIDGRAAFRFTLWAYLNEESIISSLRLTVCPSRVQQNPHFKCFTKVRPN